MYYVEIVDEKFVLEFQRFFHRAVEFADFDLKIFVLIFFSLQLLDQFNVHELQGGGMVAVGLEVKLALLVEGLDVDSSAGIQTGPSIPVI